MNMFAGFPAGFVWGTATAAYQIEGAVDEDGRGPSIWDTFATVPGAIANGDTGAVACDHYHRYAEDVDLMAGLGVNAYRFSIAWPRIQPDGTGPANPKGLDFYRRLLERLRERGITPWVTLYHWDLPQALQDRGGWPERDTADRFADYVALVRDGLGDLVQHWITLNEPKAASFGGYGEGIHAPGIRDVAQRERATHHLLLAHDLASRVLENAGQVGIVLDLSPVDPFSPSDRPAAQQLDADLHRAFLEPVMATPPDFLGINYYRRMLVRDGAVVVPDGVPVTTVGWPIQPAGLRDVLVGLRDEYPNVPPIYITENGAALESGVDDPHRVAYLRSHLLALHEAIAAGVDIRGYFLWTLMDNFEWAEGYRAKFGLFAVEPDQRRVPRASARFFAQVASTNMVD
jgi:beta-glucosidase